MLSRSDTVRLLSALDDDEGQSGAGSLLSALDDDVYQSGAGRLLSACAAMIFSLFLLGSAARAIQVCGGWYAEMASFRTAWMTCGLRIRTARARFWVGAVEQAGAMEIIDTDGDHLRFQIDSSGSLQEFLNGQLEIDRITELHYDAVSRKVTDDTGEFCLRVDSQVDVALGLNALAELAGVPWTGDEPVDQLVQAAGELEVAFEGCLSVDGSRRRLVRACEAIRSLLEEGFEALRGVAAEGLL